MGISEVTEQILAISELSHSGATLPPRTLCTGTLRALLYRDYQETQQSPSSPHPAELSLFHLPSVPHVFLNVCKQTALLFGWSLTFCFPVHCNRLFSFCCKQQLVGVFLFLSSTSPALPPGSRGLMKNSTMWGSAKQCFVPA